MSNNDKHKEMIGERTARASLQVTDPVFFRDVFESIPELEEIEEIPKTKPKTKEQAEYLPNPALAVRYRHSDYNTLNRVVDSNVKLVRNMGLRVSGPIFLPSSGWWKGSDIMLNRIAIMLVSGSAETLVRYTQRASSLPRHGAKLEIRLERAVAGKPYTPAILMRTTP